MIAHSYSGIIKVVFQTNQDGIVDNQNQQESKCVFISAGSSPTGRAVTRQLSAAGYVVTAMAANRRDAEKIRADGGQPVYCDPAQPGEIKAMMTLAKANIVVHTEPQLANDVPFQSNGDYSPAMLRDGTVRMLECAEATGVSYFLHLSYAFLYGDQHGTVVDESAGLKADSEIAQAAKAAEAAVMASAIPAGVLRAGYVYGSESTNLDRLAQALRAGRPVSANDNHAGWVHAEDLAQAVRLMVEQMPENAVFNIANDTPMTTQAFLHLFSESMGINPSGKMPGFLMRVFAARQDAPLLAFSSKPDSQKAKNTLGWSLNFSTNAAGIEQVLLSWRAAMAVTDAQSHTV